MNDMPMGGFAVSWPFIISSKQSGRPHFRSNHTNDGVSTVVSKSQRSAPQSLSQWSHAVSHEAVDCALLDFIIAGGGTSWMDWTLRTKRAAVRERERLAHHGAPRSLFRLLPQGVDRRAAPRSAQPGTNRRVCLLPVCLPAHVGWSCTYVPFGLSGGLASIPWWPPVVLPSPCTQSCGVELACVASRACLLAFLPYFFFFSSFASFAGPSLVQLLSSSPPLNTRVSKAQRTALAPGCPPSYDNAPQLTLLHLTLAGLARSPLWPRAAVTEQPAETLCHSSSPIAKRVFFVQSDSSLANTHPLSPSPGDPLSRPAQRGSEKGKREKGSTIRHLSPPLACRSQEHHFLGWLLLG